MIVDVLCCFVNTLFAGLFCLHFTFLTAVEVKASATYEL